MRINACFRSQCPVVTLAHVRLATGAQRMSGLDVFSGVSHSRPQSPSFLCLLGRLQIKPSGSGDENGRFCNCFEG